MNEIRYIKMDKWQISAKMRNTDACMKENMRTLLLDARRFLLDIGYEFVSLLLY